MVSSVLCIMVELRENKCSNEVLFYVCLGVFFEKMRKGEDLIVCICV